MENNTVNEGKTIAIISYITIIGTLIAFIMNMSKKNAFASFHIKQMIGLNLLYFVNQYIIYKYAGNLAGWIVGVLIFVLWVIGFVGVTKGEKKEVPVVGEYFQKWFQGI